MGRNTWRYDYPRKEGCSLSELSKKHLGKSYCETTTSEERKLKKLFRELNR